MFPSDDGCGAGLVETHNFTRVCASLQSGGHAPMENTCHTTADCNGPRSAPADKQEMRFQLLASGSQTVPRASHKPGSILKLVIRSVDMMLGLMSLSCLACMCKLAYLLAKCCCACCVRCCQNLSVRVRHVQTLWYCWEKLHQP